MINLPDQNELKRNATNHKLHLRRMIATSVFLAIALILRTYFSTYLTFMGAQGARVGIHGIFIIMPAILFGPFYGAVASGLGDLLGHFIRPSGPWLWQMTIIMTLGGFVRGWAWRLLRGRNPVSMRVAVIAITVLFLGFGSLTMIQLRQDGITRSFYDGVENPSEIDASQMGFISRMIVVRTQNLRNEQLDPPTLAAVSALSNRIDETAFAPMAAGVFGVVLLGVDLILSKGLKKGKAGKVLVSDVTPQSFADEASPKGLKARMQSFIKAPWNGSIMSLALTVILVSLLINIANSTLLWAINFGGWRTLPFMYIWLPRAALAFFISVVNTFIIVLLMGACYKQPHIRAMID